MIRYLSMIEVLDLHRQMIEMSGGAIGIKDLGESLLIASSC